MSEFLIFDVLNVDVCIIWLYGLGVDCIDFKLVVEVLQMVLLSICFIFFQVLSQVVMVNGGWVMLSWYDIFVFSLVWVIDEDQLNVFVDQVIVFIDEQCVKGIVVEWIIFVGFLQGGVVVLYIVFCCYVQLFGGVLVLFIYVLIFDDLVLDECYKWILVLYLYGSQDDVVDLVFGCVVYDVLQVQGVEVGWYDYLMGYEVFLEEIYDIGVWLCKCF